MNFFKVHTNLLFCFRFIWNMDDEHVAARVTSEFQGTGVPTCQVEFGSVGKMFQKEPNERPVRNDEYGLVWRV